MKQLSFERKLFNVIGALILVKIFLALFTGGGLNFRSFIIALVILALLLFIIRLVLRGNKAKNNADGGNALVGTEMFNRVQREYEDLAAKYIQQKEYRKAADIYLRLLKNPYRAAQTLEEGKLYSEAAIVYLDRLQNKNKAAECYELARDYTRSIPLWKELGSHEKVGDLYRLLNDQAQANEYYNLVVSDYIEKDQYLKASLLYKDKMGMPYKGKALLLRGWYEQKDAFNCLNNYLNYLEQDKEVMDTLTEVADAAAAAQKEILLQVLKYEYHKRGGLQEPIRDMAYELIAERLPRNPRIAEQLKDFVPEDKVLSKDISRYQSRGNRVIGF